MLMRKSRFSRPGAELHRRTRYRLTRTTDQANVVGRGFRSPAALFCLWIALSLVLVNLRWSSLIAPTFQWQTLPFMILALAVFAMIMTVDPGNGRVWDPAPLRPALLWILALYYSCAFAVSWTVPLVQIVRGQPYEVYGFGLPGLHILALALSGYLAVRYFSLFLSSRSLGDLARALLPVAFLLLIANRSAISFVALAWTILMIRRLRVRFIGLVLLIAGILLFLIAFGVLGTARLGVQIFSATGTYGSDSAIANVSRATDAFYRTGLPTDWLWVYSYFTSPIVNLDQAFAFSGEALCGRSCDLLALTVWELMPDVFSVRVGPLLGLDEFDKAVFLKVPELTASTAFGSAVGYAGLVGAALMLLALVGLVILVYGALNRSDVREEGLALLGCVLFFSFFENMIAYSPLFFQLCLPLLRTRWRTPFL